MITLTERYIAATVDHLPAKQRDEIAEDLRASIADAVDGRVESGTEADAAEVDVLNDLGDPERLAATYADRPLALIGPRLFLQWKRLLVLLLWIVVPIVALASLAGSLIGDDSWWGAAGSALHAAWLTAINIGFWVTAVFAVLDRASAKEVASMTTPWTVDRLPAQPEYRVTWGETVISAATLVITGAAIIWQQLDPWVYDHFGNGLPLINPGLWTFVLPALLAVMAVELVTVIRRQVRGRWTMGDFGWVLGVNIASVALVVPPLLMHVFLNRAMFAEVGWPDAATTVSLSDVELMFAVAVVAIAIVDVVTSYRKARRASAVSQ